MGRGATDKGLCVPELVLTGLMRKQGCPSMRWWESRLGEAARCTRSHGGWQSWAQSLVPQLQSHVMPCVPVWLQGTCWSWAPVFTSQAVTPGPYSISCPVSPWLVAYPLFSACCSSCLTYK